MKTRRGARTELESALMNLRDDTASFRDFVRDTRHVWERFARYLCKRWRPPLGVDVEDVTQELVWAAWKFVHQWDPSRGTTIDQYVRFNALDKAKKWLLRQRNTKRRDGSAPARVPACFTSLERADDEAGSVQDRLAVVGPVDFEELEEGRDRRRRLERAVEAVSHLFEPLELECLAYLLEEGGSSEATAARLLADRQLCQALRVGSDDDADRVVASVLTKVLDVMQPEEPTCP